MTMLCHSGEAAVQISVATAAVSAEDINPIPMRLVLAAVMTFQVTLLVSLVFPRLNP